MESEVRNPDTKQKTCQAQEKRSGRWARNLLARTLGKIEGVEIRQANDGKQ